MAKYTLGERAAKQIAALIKDGDNPGGPKRIPGRGYGIIEPIIVGKIDGTLARNGTATLSIYKPSTSGGIGTDTSTNQTIIDVGQIGTTDSPLAASTSCTAAYSRGAWVLISYDCDAQ